MQYLGFFLLIVFVAGIIGGLLQMAKAKKILAAPFKKTGEVASNPSVADAKGMISVEGQVACANPLKAPQTGQACVYYEHKLEEEFTKSTLTEQGTKTSKEWKTISHQKQGTTFQVDDGSGAINVNAMDSVDGDLQRVFSGPPGAGGNVAAAAAGLVAAALTGGNRFRVTEHIIPAQGKMFVLGKLAGGQITKTDGMMGKIMLSGKGREGLLGATNRNKIIAFVLAGVGLVAGVPLSIFGSPPETDECSSDLKDTFVKACRGHIKDDDGKTFTWTVAKDGDYILSVTQPNVKYPIWPRVTLSDSAGKKLGQIKATGYGQTAKFVRHFAAGSYKFNIRDDVDGYAAPFAQGGGLSFWVDVQGATPEEMAAAGEGSAASLPTAPTSTAAAVSAAMSASAAPKGGTAPKPGSAPSAQPKKKNDK
jgi:hypothetical protein